MERLIQMQQQHGRLEGNGDGSTGAHAGPPVDELPKEPLGKTPQEALKKTSLKAARQKEQEDHIGTNNGSTDSLTKKKQWVLYLNPDPLQGETLLHWRVISGAVNLTDRIPIDIRPFFVKTRKGSRIAVVLITHTPPHTDPSQPTSLPMPQVTVTEELVTTPAKGLPTEKAARTGGGGPEPLSQRPLILFSHGNSADIGYQCGSLARLALQTGANILVYDYSGYGISTRLASERNTYADIRAVYAYAIKELRVPSHQIILYGQSVGSGPSIDLATDLKAQPPGGLVVHAGIASGMRMFKPMKSGSKSPWFDLYKNVDKLGPSLRCPMFVMHGKKDEQVLPYHAQQLANKCPSDKLWELWFVPGADHNDIELKAPEEYCHKMKAFLSFCCMGGVSSGPPPLSPAAVTAGSPGGEAGGVAQGGLSGAVVDLGD
uniref:AB hydrolase-1 domain-containing protein n=1 Tax=Chromera velia CCMP2878 TaxID=1169474 RepID=A0A0G4HVI8_9ALVE|eukprot:Cvel_32196.t1-p1 / transcript=Cvel_32196.t1 / gene=Cvel_32196 / organism=Chromera_velia_CCMP2878 / gene_product=Alpha/beta hydrolase domain-containing protein 17C, putative / transcript_product=Alpha/beta hydrolase domain-containing protein 17C, putative / location=Cvel_scaffold4948:4435-6166(+) / protein_length=430 / sequence_SO=supercontig / SO=protein_coding / is_pseudo=false